MLSTDHANRVPLFAQLNATGLSMPFNFSSQKLTVLASPARTIRMPLRGKEQKEEGFCTYRFNSLHIMHGLSG